MADGFDKGLEGLDRGPQASDAALALDLLRRRGIATGIITNQSGIARGLLTPDQVDRVNREVEHRLVLQPQGVQRGEHHEDRDDARRDPHAEHFVLHDEWCRDEGLKSDRR